MKNTLIAPLLLTTLAIVTSAQIPISSHLAILKAEDSRAYGPPIERLFQHPNPEVRTRAVLAAGRIGDDAAVEALGKLLDSERVAEVRAMIAFALGEIESIEAATIVKAALNKSDAMQVNARLVEAAGKIAGANINDAQAADLRSSIVSVLDAENRKGAKADRETVLLGLTAALRSASRDSKRERPDPTDIAVASFLTSTDARVRADAANTLSRVRAKNANEILRKLLTSDSDPIVRANAARALGAAEDNDAADKLISAAVGDSDPRVRISAVRSLATLRDPKAAEPLMRHAASLLAAYKTKKMPSSVPAEHNEFVEIAVALGRMLANTRNEQAVGLFREFGKIDLGITPEVYIARLRIAPGRDGGDKPELIHWRQYSTVAQMTGEFATLEPTTEEAKQMKSEAPDILRPLARAYAEADPVEEKDTILAAADVLRAYARFKTSDLHEVLITALKNKDIFVRATAAELLGELPSSAESLAALDAALEYAMVNDVQYNDAVLATLDAMFKLDKRKSLPALELAAGSLDQVVRMKVLDLLKDDELKDKETLPVLLRNLDRSRMLQVRPHAGKGTKLGQVLNTDADYRRALSRKNGSVRAVIETRKGTFSIEFLPEDAPLTVDNFIKLARSGYFNGLEVHRVVPNFVVQDGDPRGDGNGGPGWSIRCEINTVPYERGAVGMALSGKDTGGSQWFVTHSPQPHLDGGYTVFGRVNETGMRVVDKIVRGDEILSVRVVEGTLPQRTQRRK